MTRSINYQGKSVICKGDITTTGGYVLEGTPDGSYICDGLPIALKGHNVSCPACDSIGVIAEGVAGLDFNNIPVALEGHMVACRCPPGSHRLIAKSTPGATTSAATGYQCSLSSTAHPIPVQTSATAAYQHSMSPAQHAPAADTASLQARLAQQSTAMTSAPVQKVCRYCLRDIELGNACTASFHSVIRESIDAGHNINGVFQALCTFYVEHFDIWQNKHVSKMFSDLHDVVGKNFDSLSSTDKKRFFILIDRQVKTNFYGLMYNHDKRDPSYGEHEYNYDKVQHLIAGLWLGSKYSYSTGLMTAWAVEKIDTYKVVWGELTGTRKRHHIGFDWYDYAFTVAGAALGHLLSSVEAQRCLKDLTLFASGAAKFDSFYTPPKLNYLGIGKIDPVFPVTGGNSEQIERSLDVIFKTF
ncbi:PAAR domain-containing protein [Serratia microhaemolytica]|uniref:PAAR domain-containing protein n=1 Tax=Serratia microhaemolytica TaxID=2675110 RepID=UPI000FDF1F40|nr:PAAR domain-containing protein [Serratia microhaemolytica]